MFNILDNNLFFHFFVDSPPLLSWDNEEDYTSLRSWVDLRNSRSSSDCSSHHILTDSFRSITLISSLLYYYIVISLHNNIYWCCLSPLFLVSDNIFPLLILISLRHFVTGQDFCFCCRSRYLFRKWQFIPFFCWDSFISLIHLLCFQSCVLMNLRQLMRLPINDLLMAIGRCTCAHQQWDC